MQHNTLRPRQALNKAYLRQKTARNDMERFKAALCTLLDSINLHETEEHAKNHLRDFLKAAFYSGYGINTKGRTDLVIHTGPTTKSSAGVLLEVKRPGNRADMPGTDNLNYKAMHELLLYYLQERVQHKNHDLRHLIVTNVHEWFVFDALEFDRVFYRNSQLRKDFTDWSEGRKSSSGTDFFYKEIAAPAIASLTDTLTYTWFDLRESEKALRNRDLRDDVKLVQLYKLFSPPHLLKEAFANDANSLDRDFYLELLHIIGLEEVKEGGRKLIRRKAKPSAGSLLEAAYQKLRSEDLISGLDNPYTFGNTREEQLFNVALELCITWMNRVLFLKLLEAQLISYHQGDRSYAFMSTEHLREFDDLNELFFDVLAERPAYRTANVRQKFAHIPYLNSSLFETTALEKRTLRISNLKDRSLLAVYPQSVLRNQQGKSLGKSQGELPTLEYLLRFLGSYDFGAEGREEIQEENKTLITASVLGLIFEKINGYRDGSFYTPGFITMYMSREAIRRAVVERFNEAFGWEAKGFESLQFQLNRQFSPEAVLEGNRIINSLRICDPAVGSGHYLVSALNELIVIKWELGLLLNRQHKPLRAGSIEVQNDELIVTDYYGELFSYTVHQQPDGSRTINPQVQEIQETLFHEKQTIIENCLFGVDINPNSVKICRLRLWIELLKNAYYRQHQEEPGTDRYSDLQTLPNIDINIKQGNSLLSRYPLTADLQEAFGRKGHSLQAYREAVLRYKHTNSKEQKKKLEFELDEIKQGYKTSLSNRDPLRKALSKIRGELSLLDNNIDLFGNKFKKEDDRIWEKKRLTKLLDQKEKEAEAIEKNAIYKDAFEWRFEFPEVLDESGKYTGFDVVVGNPPYVMHELKAEEKKVFNKQYQFTKGKPDLYKFFIELGLNILMKDGFFFYIIPSSLNTTPTYKAVRNFIISKNKLIHVVNFYGEVFNEASVNSSLILIKKGGETLNFNIALDKSTKASEATLYEAIEQSITVPVGKLRLDPNILISYKEVEKDQGLIDKINSHRSLSTVARYTLGLQVYHNSIHNEEQINDRVYHSKQALDETYMPETGGRNISRYYFNPTVKEYVSYGEWCYNKPDREFCTRKRLLIREITSERGLVCAITDTTHVSNKAVIVVISELLPTEFLLGLLNSALIGYYINKTTEKGSQRLFPRVSLTTIKNIPIAQADEETKAGIRALVEQVLAAKQADAGADTSSLEAGIDLQVYRLYDLSYDEVLLVDPAFAMPREEYEAVLYLKS